SWAKLRRSSLLHRGAEGWWLMGTWTRSGGGGRTAIRLTFMACLIAGMTAGCEQSASPGHGSAAKSQAPSTSASAAAQTPAAQPPGVLAFTASCPDHGETSASGCGSWDAGPPSGQAPGFADGEQSAPNLLGVNQNAWSGGHGPQVLNAAS